MKKLIITAICAVALLASCTSPSVPDSYNEAQRKPKIYPEYTDVTIPCNIAPMNFMVAENCEEAVAKFTYGNEEAVYGDGTKIIIPENDWKNMTAEAKGKSIKVEVYTRSGESWTKFKSFSLNVATDEIDPYISYRLIPPSYVAYEKLTINQRNLTNFEEKTIYNNMIVSTEANGQCINCHSYQNYRTDNMQFHMRQGFGGTMIVADGKPKKVDLKTDKTISAGVYPAWHPKKKLIAYSTNNTGQSFHTKSRNKVEVQDTESDIILYDVEKNEVSIIENDSNELEVFPWWSPDGKELYFCSAHFEYKDTTAHETEMIKRYKEVKYDIYKKSFNAETKQFGPRQLVFKASEMGMSATFPRISPDGRYLLFAMGNWGCFHIWHPESDLYIMDLKSGNVRKLENVNSSEAESYHSWSSNGRWIIFGTRRDEGNFTRPYIAYFDKNGKGYKAFEVPQKDPEFYQTCTYSYNIPEFMVEPVKISPQKFADTAERDAIKAVFKD